MFIVVPVRNRKSIDTCSQMKGKC